MKSILMMAALIGFTVTTIQAQDRVREKDLVGTTWKMVFDLDEEADTAFERVILNAVDGLLDEIDIYFEFHDDYEMTVWAGAFGDEEEEEDGEWYINDHGQLFLDDTDHVDADDNIWLRDGNRLIPYERKRGRLVRKDDVYLRKVRK